MRATCKVSFQHILANSAENEPILIFHGHMNHDSCKGLNELSTWDRTLALYFLLLALDHSGACFVLFMENRRLCSE